MWPPHGENLRVHVCDILVPAQPQPHSHCLRHEESGSPRVGLNFVTTAKVGNTNLHLEPDFKGAIGNALCVQTSKLVLNCVHAQHEDLFYSSKTKVTPCIVALVKTVNVYQQLWTYIP